MADENRKQSAQAGTVLLLVTGMAMFGSATPVSKLVGDAFPPFLAGLMRVLIGTALLAAAAWGIRGQIGQIGRGDWLRIVGIAIFGMFGFSALMLIGMPMAPGAVGAAVMSMTPAVTAAGAMLFMGERPTWRKLGAVALAFAGAAVLQLGQGLESDTSDQVVLGAALVFGAICCEAAYTLLGQRVSRDVDPVLVAALGAGLSIPLFALATLLLGERLASAGTGDWIALAWYGAATLAVGSWLWYRGVARVSGVTAAAFMGVMPLSALVLSYVLLDEPFRWVHLAGFGVVFAGVLLMSWEHARMAQGSDS